MCGNEKSTMRYQTVKGMRDFFPEEQARRLQVLDAIRSIFVKWGYVPLDTPALESFGLLAAKGGGGEEIKKEIYYFKDQGKRELGMRFDLTVPAARFVSQNSNLPKPFKRYQMGKVWRYDQPQKGRFREFMQTDVDIFGSPSPKADAEIIAVACDVFKELGFKNFSIRVNNKNILDYFVRNLGIDEPVKIFRAIDKLDKIGKLGVERELLKVIDKKKTNEILKFITSKKIPFCEGKDELERVVKEVEKLGFKDNVKIDLSLVRGLEYYTSTVFEVSVGKQWSVAGGGRYDNMVQKIGGQATPAVGISLGFERIMEVMKEEKMFTQDKKVIFVAAVNENLGKEVIKIANKLREDFSVETDVMGRNLKKQLNYVSVRGLPYCIIVGEKELREEKVVLRDMMTGKEKQVRISRLLIELK